MKMETALAKRAGDVFTKANLRADAGELVDEELYPSDAQWSGLYDRMFAHKTDEIERRLALVADYGESLQSKEAI